MRRRIASTAGVLLTLVAPVAAQTTPDGVMNGWQTGFGRAVAIVGNQVLVGEPTNTFASGIVYVFSRGADGRWTATAELASDDAFDGDQFGTSLAATEQTLLVGATLQNDGAGGAYLFERRGASWSQVARVTAADGVAGDGLGGSAAIAGDDLLIGAGGHAEGAGAVYVFRRSGGGWAQAAKLTARDVSTGDRFGSSIAVHDDLVVIGAVGQNRGTGAAYVYHRDAGGSYVEQAKLSSGVAARNARFGSSLAVGSSEVMVGAPGANGSVGGVFHFAYDAAVGAWREQDRLAPFDARRRSGFGSSLALAGANVWVGSPGASGGGSIYMFDRDPVSGVWLGSSKLTARDTERRDSFGSTFAIGDDLAVVGLTGDDYGAGTASIFSRVGDQWREDERVLSEEKGLEPVLGGQMDCTEGMVGRFSCGEVDLVSFLPVQALGGGRGVRVNDMWGWMDPETRREYAIVGRLDGTSFVDVTDPANPVYLGNLPKTEESQGSVWRDIKVYQDHAFIVADGAGNHGMQVFDLRQLRNVGLEPVTFTETAHYDGIASAHNIVINEAAGFAFSVGSSSGGETCGGGLHMIDIREPTNPRFAGCFADPSTGRRGTGYSHDAQCVTYSGPDREHQGKEICLGANETALSIADVTDKGNPVALSRASYPNVGYSHQGWLTEDQRYFYMNDELDELGGNIANTRTLIWDVADLDDPILVREFFLSTKASDHNLYVKGNLLYEANYRSGLRILDITDPENPVEVAHFDTVPYGSDAAGMGGAWTNYPYFQSGVIGVTSGSEGLFLLKKRSQEIVP